jgi:phage terminase large subunit-like protein
MNIIEAFDDEHLFGKVIREPATWQAWRSFLCALFGLPMSPESAATFRQCTGRATPPSRPFREAWLVCGRRAGKSYVLALCAVYLAAFKSYADRLAPGERATCMIIAADRKQARSIFRYVKGLLSIPMLATLIEREAAESIDLNNGVTIEIQTASYRSTRGYTLAAACATKLVFGERTSPPSRTIKF